MGYGLFLTPVLDEVRCLRDCHLGTVRRFLADVMHEESIIVAVFRIDGLVNEFFLGAFVDDIPRVGSD